MGRKKTSHAERMAKSEASNTLANKTALKIEGRVSQYGTPQPSIVMPHSMYSSDRHHAWAENRKNQARLHRIAAAVEDAALSYAEEGGGPREGWIVQIDDGGAESRVYLELMDGDDAEASRGMSVLEFTLEQNENI